MPNFWLQLVSAVLSIIVGVLFLRRPGEAVVTLTLLLIVFFMVEGFAKIVFSLTIRPLPNWGWVLASGIVGILLSLISFGQPHHDSSLAARCVARDPAYLRRGGSQLAGVAGASERVSCALPIVHSFQRRSEPDGRSRIFARLILLSVRSSTVVAAPSHDKLGFVHKIREGDHEPVFRSGHYWVGDRRSGLNVGIGMALPGP